MALSKEIEMGGGVTARYHRVESVQIVTNVADYVVVTSYTAQSKRAEEKEACAGDCVMDVWQSTQAFEAPYDQAMTVADAYEWLKANVSAFEGASDVFEDGQPEGGE